MLESKREDILFIINPISGGSKKQHWLSVLNNNLDKRKFCAHIEYTSAPNHATEIAHHAVIGGFKKIVAVGGDGTINEVAKVLIGTDVSLGIIPKGSGNGMARHLKIPLQEEKALLALNDCNEIAIDTASMNDIPFFCTSGVGFDAHIGSVFASSKERGLKSYLKSTVKEYLKYKSVSYRLCFDGEVIEKKAFLITFANAGQYGNNVFIAPQADIRDGFLDVCVLGVFPVYDVFNLAYRLFASSINKSKHISSYKAKELVLYRAYEGMVHLDGEPYEMGKELTIKINPSSLKVLIPV
jgi:diacylglycerol kinase (ATP)